MEQRLIDANALREKCDAPHWCVWMSEIDDEPTVDAVEVVRCKDCEYYESDECGNPYIWMSDGAHLYTQPQDFCSYGERRDSDG